MKFTINPVVLNAVLDKQWSHVVSKNDPHIGEHWVVKYAGGLRECVVAGFSHEFKWDHVWYWIVAIKIDGCDMLVLRERDDFIEQKLDPQREAIQAIRDFYIPEDANFDEISAISNRLIAKLDAAIADNPPLDSHPPRRPTLWQRWFGKSDRDSAPVVVSPQE